MREINQLKLTRDPQLLLKMKAITATAQQAEPTLLTRGGGVDSVTFSSTPTVTEPPAEPKGESYVDVLNEFSQKYGEGRSLEQAKLGVEYMTRILACEDLPEERRAEFENEKVCYEMMVIEFENWNKARDNEPESILDIQKELDDFIYKYQESNREFATERERLAYQHEYFQVIHSFYQRMYDCELTPGQRANIDQLVEQNLNEFNSICDARKTLDDKDGTTSRNNLIEQGLTDEVIDKYFDLALNADTGVANYIPKGMGNFKYTIEQKNGTTQLRIFDTNGEQTRYVVIKDGEIVLDVDTKNTQKSENTTDTERTENDESHKVTGGTYGALLSMGFTPALIQRYFDAPDPNAPANSINKFTYTLKENIEVLPGSGAYITSVEELVELLKKYGVIK